MAVETGLGWESGTFMRIMGRNEDDSNESVVAASPLGETVRKFVTAKGEWNDTWSQLLIDLNTFADDAAKRSEGWPGNSHALSGKLRRLAPNLRGVGVAVDFDDKARPKRIMLKSMIARPRQASYEGAVAVAGAEVVTAERNQYLAEPFITCYDSGGERQSDLAEALYRKLWRFWSAAPIAVAAPSLPMDFCDGAQMPVV